MSKTNKEGLTFEQWAIAARIAKFRGGEFIPLKTRMVVRSISNEETHIELYLYMTQL